MLDNITVSTIKLFVTLIILGLFMTYIRNNPDKLQKYMFNFEKKCIIDSIDTNDKSINSFINDYFIDEYNN